MRKQALLIAGLFINILLFSQGPNPSIDNNAKNGMIAGKVIDLTSNQPIEYANVVLFKVIDSSMQTGTITKNDGTFLLSEIPFGEYYLNIDFIGYEKVKKENIKIDKDNRIVEFNEIKLGVQSELLDGVEIVADKMEVEYQIDKKVINVSQNISAAGGTAVDALENQPSITVDVEGNVQLRGSSNYTVLVDGRPTALGGADLLKQIPASAIDKIEVITNPSAKYDPEGTSGIINILMKKEMQNGFNGIINASIGTNDKYSTDFKLNKRLNKFNFSLGAAYSYRMFEGTLTSDMETYLGGDSIDYLSSRYDNKFPRESYNVTAGIDYSFNDFNTIMLSSEYGFSSFSRNMYGKYHEYNNYNNEESFIRSDDEFEVPGTYNRTNLYYQHKFAQKGHEISTSITNIIWNGDISENQVGYLSGIEWPRIVTLEQSKSQENNDRLRAQANIDYVRPFGEKTKIELGYQGMYNPAEVEYDNFNYDLTQEVWTIDSSMTNEIEFLLNTQAAYTTFSSSVKNFDYQIGMRGEYTYRLLDQLTIDNKYLYESFDLFPSVHISRNLPKDQQIQLSYSRRINRPRPYFLNPYPYFNDRYNVGYGNPLLKPEFVDSYEFNYQKRIKQSMISAETYFRQTNGSITRSFRMNEENIIISSFANQGINQYYGLELNFNMNFIKWMNLNTGSNIYGYQMGEATQIDASQAQSGANFNVRLSPTFMFGKTTRLQLSGFYQGEEKTAQGKREPIFMTSAAFRKDLMKRKLTLSVSARDLFSTMKFKMTIDGTKYRSVDIYDNESPVVMFSLSYKINNYKRSMNDQRDTDGGYDGGAGGFM